MKKSDLVLLERLNFENEKILDSSVEHLVTILENSFSAIATADPELSVRIIDQLVSQREEIIAVGKDRELKREKYVKIGSSMLPDSIEFDEEDELQ